jgi:phosphoesterase RecJ-like protein
MDPYRSNKQGEAIRKALSDLLVREVKDPRVGLVTVTAVELNRDQSVARVFVSILGDDEERAASMQGLAKASGFLQRKLGGVLRLRQTPELRFLHDDAIARGSDIDQMLRDLAQRGEFETETERLRRLELADLAPPEELLAALRAGRRTWIVPHWNPDPDAMGAALALGEALRALGQDVRVFSYPNPPVNLGDLPGMEETTAAVEAASLIADEAPDLLVIVDCHRRERCGALAEVLGRIENAWCIDHHLISGRRAPLPGWVDNRACSACALVHQVIQALAADEENDLELTLSMATNIYAGLFNDTGGFRFSNTLPFSFELARRLAGAGVDTAEVARKTLYRFRPEGMALMQRFLASFSYHAGGRVLTARVDRAMLEETGASLADTETFVNLATAVEGVRYVAFMKELEAGLWRVSLRARGAGDVESVAARHGGGGHRQAAGCTLEGESAEVQSLLVSELAAQLAD